MDMLFPCPFLKSKISNSKKTSKYHLHHYAVNDYLQMNYLLL